MSNIKVQGNVSGSGTLTIAAPNTNTDRTLTLPDESGTLLSSGGPISVGGLVTLTNGGIKFPASQVASADANTLDDYEEGSWTPTLTASGSNPTVTYSYQIGNYVKIGRLVYASYFLGWSSLSGGSGNMKVNGTPFVFAESHGNDDGGGSVTETSGVTYPTGRTFLAPNMRAGTTDFYIVGSGSGLSSTAIDISNFASGGGYVLGTAIYITNT